MWVKAMAMPYLSAVSMTTLILYICVQKKLIQGMTVGGLKG